MPDRSLVVERMYFGLTFLATPNHNHNRLHHNLSIEGPIVQRNAQNRIIQTGGSNLNSTEPYYPLQTHYPVNPFIFYTPSILCNPNILFVSTLNLHHLLYPFLLNNPHWADLIRTLIDCNVSHAAFGTNLTHLHHLTKQTSHPNPKHDSESHCRSEF